MIWKPLNYTYRVELKSTKELTKEKQRGVSKKNLIDLLIKNGADVNVQDNEGFTPLSLIHPASTVHDECVSILVKEFAKLNFANIPISERDTNLIQGDPNARQHFEDCKNEISRMERTPSFIHPARTI